MVESQISLDQIRKNSDLVAFLEAIPRIKRMVVLKPLAEKYRSDADPHEYMRRVRRTILTDFEIAEIIKSAKAEGFSPDEIREAKEVASQLKFSK